MALELRRLTGGNPSQKSRSTKRDDLSNRAFSSLNSQDGLALTRKGARKDAHFVKLLFLLTDMNEPTIGIKIYEIAIRQDDPRIQKFAKVQSMENT